MARRKNKECWLLGVGLDNDDGHKRLTKGKRFLILGGSQETHEHMTEKVWRMDSRLKKKGKTFADLDPQEFRETYLEE
ncbi:MAG: hypothetical protein ACYS8W_16985 [Planctomycetota bacterium]|jgi:hypothetical protein